MAWGYKGFKSSYKSSSSRSSSKPRSTKSYSSSPKSSGKTKTYYNPAPRSTKTYASPKPTYKAPTPVAKPAPKPAEKMMLSSIDNKMHPASWWSSGQAAQAAAAVRAAQAAQKAAAAAKTAAAKKAAPAKKVAAKPVYKAPAKPTGKPVAKTPAKPTAVTKTPAKQVAKPVAKVPAVNAKTKVQAPATPVGYTSRGVNTGNVGNFTSSGGAPTAKQLLTQRNQAARNAPGLPQSEQAGRGVTTTKGKTGYVPRPLNPPSTSTGKLLPLPPGRVTDKGVFWSPPSTFLQQSAAAGDKGAFSAPTFLLDKSGGVGDKGASSYINPALQTANPKLYNQIVQSRYGGNYTPPPAALPPAVRQIIDAMNNIRNNPPSSPYSPGPYNPGGGGGGGGSPYRPPAAPIPTPTTPTAPRPPTGPTPSPPATPQPNPNVPTPNVGTFTNTGRPGTYGRFLRQRRGRGPMTNLSLTPEMIRRLAMRRL